MYHGDSQALYSDDNSIFPLSSNAKEALFAKGREFFMDSGTNTNYGSDYNRHFYGNQSTNTSPSGLLRFRSAPSSLLESFIDEVETGVKNSGENQGLASRFDSSEAQANQFSHSCNGYALNSPLLPQYPRPNPSSNSTQLSSVNGGYRVPSSIGVDHHQQQPKMVSNLTRQNSSPAELFSHLSAQSGYAKMRGTERFRLGDDASEHLSPSSTMSKGPMNFSSGIPSSSYSFPLGMLSRISEIESDNGGTSTGPDDEKLENKVYGSPFETWNNIPSKFARSFTGLKREVDSDHNLFPDSYQGGENRNQPHILSHHLSLPKSSAGIAAVEKFFQFPNTVPCKIRAKRGCATHPRSIAERVRRTRISERMRKLQELVPYMDKETNTASMLDSAVDYIKDLQKQYKTLCDIRAKCKCSAMKRPVPDQMA